MERRPGPEEGELLWAPRPEQVARSRLTDYVAWLARERGLATAGYPELWEWSTGDIASFWDSIWRYFEVVGDRGRGEVLKGGAMPAVEWYPGATLNYAENALQATSGSEPALIAFSELRPRLQLSGDEVRQQVGSVAAHLREMGVGKGDRVAAYLPNTPEAVIACLATVSLGAIWSSCSPDFGERAVLDRFEQIRPKVLLAADGYRYGGRDFDRREVVAKLRTGLPSLVQLVMVPYLTADRPQDPPGSTSWGELVRDAVEPEFVRVAFDHPLWILYSSGTTGPPKPIVHSHGGIVLEHLKVLGLHSDLGAGDRSFWFTTTGWMMWNYLISGLLVGAAVVLYDGSPAAPDLSRLWEVAADARVTHFGTSAGHLSACMKVGVQPAKDLDLEDLRFVGSTGSPLSPAGFDWVYQSVNRDLWLASLSGGTDLCTAFVLGCPWLPVRAGVIQCRGLGARVEAFDEAGTEVIDEVGELVITQPMPSMPVFFWGDADGSRYRESYFSTFPRVWRHGDWIKVRADGGVVIYGRSDSTINRNGVRMGTAEIYRLVEEAAEFSDSLVVDVAQPDGGSRLALFVVLTPGLAFTDRLEAGLKQRIRTELSPRHVPDLIQEVARIPRTRSGKKLEVPLKRILEGMAQDKVLDPEAVDDPDSLGPFLALAAKWSAEGGAGSSD
ncbi:MAG: acetoacetate--CoA ligase [Candidatus Dormiibacterota bacterium]